MPTAGGIFDESQAAAIACSDGEHWWFRSKARLVGAVLCTRCPPPGDGLLVDLGAGGGGVTARIRRPGERVLAVEGSPSLADHTRRTHGLPVTNADIARLPLADGVAHVVTALDVIEHLPDPVPALAEARRILSDDGRLVVNVPAYPRLWSAADEVLGHVRRYTRAALHEHLDEAGFTPLFASHVFSWLTLPVWYVRCFRGASGTSDTSQLGLDRASPLLSRIATALGSAESRVLARTRLPVGTSILALAAPRVGGGHATVSSNAS
jgi:SAM-dependent methyltransferase